MIINEPVMVKLGSEPVVRTDALDKSGCLFADVDAEGKIVGIEILSPCEVFVDGRNVN